MILFANFLVALLFDLFAISIACNFSIQFVAEFVHLEMCFFLYVSHILHGILYTNLHTCQEKIRNDLPPKVVPIFSLVHTEK